MICIVYQVSHLIGKELSHRKLFTIQIIKALWQKLVKIPCGLLLDKFEAWSLLCQSKVNIVLLVIVASISHTKNHWLNQITKKFQ